MRRRRPSPKSAAPPDLKELEALTGALNKSAERVQTLWFTFLSVSLYFALAVGTTTHRMLLLEEGLSLPLVNVKLPLLGFYAIGPAFYVAFHAYLLMMLVLLARTAKTFVTTLGEVLPEDTKPLDHERFRMRIENALFLQIIVGARREREGANGRVLRGLALVSLAVVPVLLLLAFQLMFLPYHWELMTWWHRGMVMLDLLLVWTLWPSYRRHWGERMAPDWFVRARDTTRLVGRRALGWARASRWLRPRGEPGTRRPAMAAASAGRVPLLQWRPRFLSNWGEVGRDLRRIAVAGVSAVVLVFSLAMATFPDERVHGNRVAAAIDEAGRWGLVWAGYRLPEPGDDISSLSEEDRNRTVGYDGGRLTAWLFGWEMPIWRVTVDKRGWFPNRLWLPDEDFVDDETLKRLLADNTKGEKGEVKRVAYAVDLRGRDLTGAVLVGADLQSADLKEARIARANLAGAWLQSARLVVTDSGGASLDFARLQGASLERAQLQGASLEWAQLQGASLERAQLQGASLIEAQLQGVLLLRAQLQGASLAAAQVWRAWGEPENAALMGLGFLEQDPLPERKSFDAHFSAWFLRILNFNSWSQEIIEQIPKGFEKDQAVQRLAILAPTTAPPEDEIQPDYWAEAERQGAAALPGEFADFLVALACAGGDGAPYVARGLLRNGRLAAAGKLLPEVAARLARSRPGGKDFDPTMCPGTADFTDADWKNLDRLVLEKSG